MHTHVGFIQTVIHDLKVTRKSEFSVNTLKSKQIYLEVLKYVNSFIIVIKQGFFFNLIQLDIKILHHVQQSCQVAKPAQGKKNIILPGSIIQTFVS
jgi:hypothetical protein